MSRFRFAVAALCLLFGAALTLVPLEAALDDFTVVNRTGGTIEELWFVSTAVDWEENVLGRHPLHDTHRRRTSVSYYEDCYWDVVAVYGDGSELNWEAIDLCSVWEITLRCNTEACWATFR
jgi:hypothetical protein